MRTPCLPPLSHLDQQDHQVEAMAQQILDAIRSAGAGAPS